MLLTRRNHMFTFKLVQNEETPVIQLLPLNNVCFHYVEPSDECDTRQATEKDSWRRN
ncbi:unnamed protein product [Brassica rapa subsp. trilocularis]